MLTYILSLTLLTGAVIVLRAIFKKKVPARLTYAIWLAVVLRLCIPFDFIQVDMPVGSFGIDSVTQNFDSFISDTVDVSEGDEDAPLQNTPALPEKDDVNTATPGNTAENVGGTVGGLVPDGNVGNINGNGTVSDNSQGTVNGTVSENKPDVMGDVNGGEADVQTDTDSEELARSMAETVIRILGTVWVLGSAVTLCVFGASYAAFAVKLRRNREYFGKTGKTRIYVSDKVTSPCVSGIIPTIYITPEAAKSESLPVILLHEKTHMAHGDHLWNVVRVAAVVLHWWNPLVWAAAILSRRDAELACDESVAKAMNSRDRLEYAKMIVAMTPVKKNYAVGFASGSIKERVMRLTGVQTTKLIAVLLSVAIVVSCALLTFVGAKEEDPEDAAFTVSPAEDFEVTASTRGGVAVAKYVGERTEVVIPSEIDGETVKEIAPSAFEGNKTITSVILPISVKCVGRAAFKDCTSLSEVELAEVNRLEDYAFEGCTSLTHVKVPGSIGVWESCVFRDSGLKKVTIDEGVGVIGESAFFGTPLREAYLPSSVVSIEDLAFAQCKKLEKIQLNEGLVNIYGSVFAYCEALREVTIPSTIEYIGEIAFRKCASLERVTFMGDVPESGYWYREVEGVDYESVRAECPDYTVYYRSGAKGFTYPTWEGYASCVIGEEQVASLKINDEIAGILNMTPAEITSAYGEMTLEYSEYGPGQPVYSLEKLDGVKVVYANHPMTEELPEGKLPYEVIVTDGYSERVCGLVCGLDLKNAVTNFEWTDAWLETMDQMGRYAKTTVGEHNLTVVMELGAVLDYEGYADDWKHDFIRDPFGVVSAMRIGKTAYVPDDTNEENKDENNAYGVPAEFEGLPQYTVELDETQGSSSLYIEMGNLMANPEFNDCEHKLVTVTGLSAPVYIEVGQGSSMLSVSAYGYKSSVGPTVSGDALYGNISTQLYEYEGYIILSRDYYYSGDTWTFSPEGTGELHPAGGISLTLYYGDDGVLMYRRQADKFNADAVQIESAPLELAVSRYDFLYNTGKVILINGALGLGETEKIFSVSDVYDLDKIYEDNKDKEWFISKYPGCKSADDVLATNAGTFVPEPEPTYPDSLNLPSENEHVALTVLEGNAVGKTPLADKGYAIYVSDSTDEEDFMTYVITPYADVPSGAITTYTVEPDGREAQGIYQSFGDIGVGIDCPQMLIGLKEDIVGKMGVYYSINGKTEFYRIVEDTDGDAVLERSGM